MSAIQIGKHLLVSVPHVDYPNQPKLSRMRSLSLNHHRQLLMHSLFLVALEIARERFTRIENVPNRFSQFTLKLDTFLYFKFFLFLPIPQ